MWELPQFASPRPSDRTLFSVRHSITTTDFKVHVVKPRQLPDIDQLKYKPDVYSMEVAQDTAKLFESMKLVPTLALLDPCGYLGLTRDLIHETVC